MSDAVQLPSVVLAHEAPFALGDLAVRPATREVLASGFRDTLEPRVMQVLVCLARARNEVVSRDDLAQRCWEGRVVGEDAINRVISRLRRLSERDAGVSFTLETITKVGYRLVETARIKPGPPSNPAEPGRPPSRAPSARQTPRRWLWLGGGALLLAAVAAALIWQPWRQDRSAERSALERPRIAGAVHDDYETARQTLDGGTAEDVARAVSMLQDVVRRAPDWAEAWGLLALAHLSSARYTPPEAQDGVEALARDAADHALRLDPREPQARFVLAAMKTFVGHWMEARRAFEGMLQDNPRSRLFLNLLGAFDTAAGEVRAALALYRSAPEDLHARNARDASYYATMLANVGEIGGAANVLDDAARQWPRNISVFFTRFWFNVFTGHPEKALAAIQDAQSRPTGIDPQDFDLYRDAALAFITRNPDDIARMLEANAAAGARGRGYAQNAMRMAAALGHLDLAFNLADAIYFDRGDPLGKLMFSGAQGQYAIGGSRPIFMLFDLSTAAMRQDLRFAPIAEELGLGDYWRESGDWPDFCTAEPAAGPVCEKLKAGP